jgi:hypothetical protein
MSFACSMNWSSNAYAYIILMEEEGRRGIFDIVTMETEKGVR